MKIIHTARLHLGGVQRRQNQTIVFKVPYLGDKATKNRRDEEVQTDSYRLVAGMRSIAQGYSQQYCNSFVECQVVTTDQENHFVIV